MGIRVDGITKRFGDFLAVDDVSFEVRPGELVALLGPSGGGKSTLLRIIAGLETADEGSIALDGESVDGVDPRKRRVGFVFQHYALFRHMTVEQNIGFGLRVQRVPTTELRRRVDELVRIMGLNGLGNRLPSELSGGQRQRVALARALAPRPRLLLLDEPFAAVDAKVREELRTWLHRLHEELNITSIFVTHDQEEAFALANRVIIIRDGRLEQAGTPMEVMDEPATEFVARFIGEANVLDGVVRKGQAEVGSLRIPAPSIAEGESARVVVRAYDVKYWRDDAGVATVRRLVLLGDRVRVEAELDGGTPMFAQFPRRSSLLRGVEPGCRIAVEVTRARVYPLEDARRN